MVVVYVRLPFSTARLICRLVSVTAELFVEIVTLDNIYCFRGGTKDAMLYLSLLRRGKELKRLLLQRKICSVSF